MNTRLSGAKEERDWGRGLVSRSGRAFPLQSTSLLRRLCQKILHSASNTAFTQSFFPLTKKKPSATTLPLWCSCLESVERIGRSNSSNSVKGDARQAAVPPWGLGGIDHSIHHTCLE